MPRSLLLWASLFLLFECQQSLKPHIVFVLADDIGWADYGFRTPELKTPHLDKLHATGVRLDNYYVQPMCTPTRAALLTGRYPIRQGLQHSILLASEARSLPLDEVTLPQVLQHAGYRTHLVGKWHLGFYRWEVTPTFRGFDSFYGFYNGLGSYYTHELLNGYDFQHNTAPDYTARGRYATELYTKRAKEIIAEHPADEPLFMLIAHQAPHYPAEAPPNYTTIQFEGDPNRTIYASMLCAMDHSIGQVVEALKAKGMWDSTIFVFSSDNGGPIPGDPWAMNIGANNWPLRGGKFSLTEGGVRATGIIHGGLVPPGGKTFDGLMHVTDWLPTLAAAAGIDFRPKKLLDGMNMWPSIQTLHHTWSPRKEMLINIDPYAIPSAGAAVRRGNWKLIIGHPGYPDIWWKPISDTRNFSFAATPPCTKCTPYTDDYTLTNHRGLPVQLYDIPNDPTERYDLAAQHPDIVQALLSIYDRYQQSAIPPTNKEIIIDPRANPRHFNNTWTPWLSPSAAISAAVAQRDAQRQTGRVLYPTLPTQTQGSVKERHNGDGSSSAFFQCFSLALIGLALMIFGWTNARQRSGYREI